MILLKTTRAKDQDHDLFCECHGTEPVEVIYTIKDDSGVLRACEETYDDLKAQDYVCRGSNCLNPTEDLLCPECCAANAEARAS